MALQTVGGHSRGNTKNRVLGGLIGLSGLAMLASILVIFLWTPADAQLGIVQKIFYFHLPAAFCGYAGFSLCCVASIVYLIRPSMKADVVARAGASTGLVFCGMVLLSGPLWARKSWGAFWTGEPRLVLTLALFVIFLAYVLVRLYGGRSPLARRIGAVLAIFGFADIPLVRFAVQKWQGNHPQVVMGSGQGLAPEMVPALVITSVAFALLFAALLWMAIRVGWLHERAEELHLEIGDRELLMER